MFLTSDDRGSIRHGVHLQQGQRLSERRILPSDRTRLVLNIVCLFVCMSFCTVHMVVIASYIFIWFFSFFNSYSSFFKNEIYYVRMFYHSFFAKVERLHANFSSNTQYCDYRYTTRLNHFNKTLDFQYRT